MRKKYQNSGFTLTELLVTIVMFVLIIGAVYGAYVLAQRAYRESEIAAELTQNGRVILEKMLREIRQSKEIAMDFPAERVNASEEIMFHDGHSEFGKARGGSINTIDLDSDAYSIDDYYKDMIIQIIEGVCSGQVREITTYNGVNQTAVVEENWVGCMPDISSEYKIFGSYHYIRYFKSNGFIQREVIGYYVFGDSEETLVSWDTDEILVEKSIEASKIIGEWVAIAEFWGLEEINIVLFLEKGGKTLKMETKVFGRNF